MRIWKIVKFFSKIAIIKVVLDQNLYLQNFKKNGLIIVIGRNFEYGATFLHYIEENFKVEYRYKKIFTGRIFDNKKISHSKVTYFVRNLKLDSSLKHKKDMYKILNKKKI